jgi:myo-inositol-hexaphosphate 3-phosphohydrolase
MRYRQIKLDGKWVLEPIVDSYQAKSTAIMGDFEPYKSQVTGEMIEGRKAHREHLKRHNVIEIGNEKITPQAARPDRLKEQIARQVYSKLRY